MKAFEASLATSDPRSSKFPRVPGSSVASRQRTHPIPLTGTASPAWIRPSETVGESPRGSGLEPSTEIFPYRLRSSIATRLSCLNRFISGIAAAVTTTSDLGLCCALPCQTRGVPWGLLLLLLLLLADTRGGSGVCLTIPCSFGGFVAKSSFRHLPRSDSLLLVSIVAYKLSLRTSGMTFCRIARETYDR